MQIFAALMLGLLTAIAGHTAIAAEAEPKAGASHNPGFLSDYDRLEKAGRPRSRYLAYMAPNAEGRSVYAIQLLPVTVAPKDAVFEDFEPEQMKTLILHLDSRLGAGFAKEARIARDAAGADVKLEVAITQIGVQEKGRKLLDLVPLRLVTGSIRNVTQGKALQAAATFESRILDAATGAVLRERVDHVAGADIGRAGDPTTRLTLEALLPAADDWVKTLVEATAPKLD